jgi:soluble lytic murein transglycosylase-like protein
MTARKTLLLALVLALLGPGLFSASASDLQRLYDPIVQRVARDHGLDAGFIHAVIRAESNYDPFALSEKGAMGLMQLMPDTATQYGVRNVFDPAQNIEGGARYLKDLMRLYNGTTDLVLAAYNAGQEAVRKYGSIPPYPETREYIKRVRATYNKPVMRPRGPRVVKFYDESGKLILTNDPDYFRLKKG